MDEGQRLAIKTDGFEFEAFPLTFPAAVLSRRLGVEVLGLDPSRLLEKRVDPLPARYFHPAIEAIVAATLGAGVSLLTHSVTSTSSR